MTHPEIQIDEKKRQDLQSKYYAVRATTANAICQQYLGRDIYQYRRLFQMISAGKDKPSKQDNDHHQAAVPLLKDLIKHQGRLPYDENTPAEVLDELLLDACALQQDYDEKEIWRLIKAGANPLAKDALNGCDVLNILAEKCSAELFNYLRSKGLRVDSRISDSSEMPLWFWVCRNRLSLEKFKFWLAQKEVDINYCVKSDNSNLLYYVAGTNDATEKINHLKQFPQLFKHKNSLGMNCLQEAIESRRSTEVITCLYGLCPDVNSANHKAETAFHTAIRTDQAITLQQLINLGIKMHDSFADGTKVIDYCLERKKYDCAKVINPNYKSLEIDKNKLQNLAKLRSEVKAALHAGKVRVSSDKEGQCFWFYDEKQNVYVDRYHDYFDEPSDQLVKDFDSFLDGMLRPLMYGERTEEEALKMIVSSL